MNFILAGERQAKTMMDVFRRIAHRVVALSSGDVYRAAGILHGTEPGPLQPMPLTEESDLRTKGQTYRPEVMESIRKSLPWVDDDYDKIPVERTVMSDPELAGTILRLPMVYGPGDPFHRLHPYLQRMDDGRLSILIQEDAAEWRAPRGYVENVAAGIALAATAPQAAGRIYNLAEPQSFSELEWAQQIATRRGMDRFRAPGARGSHARAFETSVQLGAALDHEQRKNSPGTGLRRTRAARHRACPNHPVGACQSAGRD